MKQMYTRTYIDRKTMCQYDNQNVIAYLNEKVIEDYVPETSMAEEKPEPCRVYQYTGTEIDGGTLLQSGSINDRNSLVNGIIRTKYTASDELAIQRHFANDPEKYTQEWNEYNDFCEDAKRQADSLMTN